MITKGLWTAFASLMLFASLASIDGCAFTKTPIPGLTVEEGDTPTETVDRIQGMVRKIEEGIQAQTRVTGSSWEQVPAGGQTEAAAMAPPQAKPPTQEPAPASTTRALEARTACLRILDTYMALASETIDTHTGLDPYDFQDRRKPLFLYPRITSPLIAESSRVSGTPSPGAPASSAAVLSPQTEWILPVILNKRVFMLPSRPSWVLGSVLSLVIPDPQQTFPDDPREATALILDSFHFSLIPREFERESEIPLDRPPAGNVEIPSIRVPLSHDPQADGSGTQSGRDGKTFRLPGAGKNTLEFVFRVPASCLADRWERKAASQRRPVRGELFDLRMFPKLRLSPRDRPGQWGDILGALGRGEWHAAWTTLSAFSIALSGSGPQRFDAQTLSVMPKDCEDLGAAIEDFRQKFPYFAPELQLLAQRVEKLGAAASSSGSPSDPEVRERMSGAARDLQMALGVFVAEDPCPAPVFLDEPEPSRKSFSFIVGADLQYDTDGSSLQQFLAMIDPARVPQSATGELPFGQVSGDLLDDLRDAKFVIIDGDLGDGKGFSSTPSSLLVDALGLSAAWSPYVDGSLAPKLGEFPELRTQMRRSTKPIFAVPGNHDGFCAFGGILNQLCAVSGAIIEIVPLLGLVGTPLKEEVAPALPTLVRFWRLAPPFYDGLVDWSLELGPHNVAFDYRGCAFVAANSFDLHQLERDQVGAIGNNWGGGLQEETLIWFDLALRYFSSLDREARGLERPPSPGDSFVFLHHDPRAALASKRGYVEVDFGHYNDITTPVNEITFGYLGLSWATYSGLFIPLISPISVGALREASYGENFQERWMRKTAWDETCYNAQGVLDAINRNLRGAPPIQREADGSSYPSARISHLFFGHDDTPVVSEWVHANGNAVFPGQASDENWHTFKSSLRGVLRRDQSEHGPGWAADMRFDDGRQATVVRLDDLGDVFSKVNTHGFSLVTVRFPEEEDARGSPGPRGSLPSSGSPESAASRPVESSAGGAGPGAAGPPGGVPKGPSVEVRWIPIPR